MSVPSRIAEVRKEYRPKIVRALESLKGTLTPEQVKLREAALKAGKSRKEVIASLKLNEEQKAKLAAMKEDRREHVRDRLAFAIENFNDLELTDEQLRRIQAIRAEYRPRVQEAGNDLRAIVREELAAIVAVLKA